MGIFFTRIFFRHFPPLNLQKYDRIPGAIFLAFFPGLLAFFPPILATIFLPVLAPLNPLAATPAFSEKTLTRLANQASEFEKSAGTAAALLLEPETGRIAFVHRPEIIFARAYPPGSLAKLWAAAVFFNNQAAFHFFPEKPLQCNGRFSIPDNIELSAQDRRLFHLPPDEKGHPSFRCAVAAGHGYVNFHSALARSCNVYFLTHAARNPALFYGDLIKLWKLNEMTGTSWPGQLELPLAIGKSPSAMQSIASAIGEGGAILLTPVKISQTYAALLAGTPLLQFGAVSAGQARGSINAVLKFRPRLISPLQTIFNSGTLKQLQSQQKISLLAGKTGTATHLQRKFKTHGWVLLYFQLGLQKYLLLTFVENGSGSGQARKLAEDLLKALPGIETVAGRTVKFGL